MINERERDKNEMRLIVELLYNMRGICIAASIIKESSNDERGAVRACVDSRYWMA